MSPHRVLFLAVTLVLALGSLTHVAQADADEFHAFLLPDINEAEINDQVVITFEVDSTAKHFNGYEIDVEWDQSVVSLLSVDQGSLMTDACPNTWFNLETTDSTVTVSHTILCGEVSIDGPGVLCIFTFQADANGTSPLEITTDPNQAFFDAGLYVWPGHATYPRQVFLHNSTICIPTCGNAVDGPEDALNRGLRMQVIPNPIRESGWIRYQIAAPAQALTIEILDVTGRQLQSWGLEPGRAGAFELRWDGTDRDGRPLPIGTYFYRARSADHRASGRFQVLR